MSSIGTTPTSSSDISDDDDDDITIIGALLNAINEGDLANVRALLEKDNGGDGDFNDLSDEYINQALCLAAARGCVESCRLLWQRLSQRGKKKYFSVQRCRDYHLPLQKAAQSGKEDVVLLFVEELKWNVNRKDCDGEVPLTYAAYSEEMTRLLSEHGADPNRGGVSHAFSECEYGPLFFAVRAGNVEVVELLLLHKADPNLNRRPAKQEEEAHADCRRTPRCTDFAIANGNILILQLLLQHGAFVGSCYTSNNNSMGTSLTILLRSTDVACITKQTVCRILIAHAAASAATDEDDNTTRFLEMTFEQTIANKNERTWQYLVDAGMEIPNPASRRRIMHIAIQAGQISCCRYLVSKYQVDPFQEDEEDDEEEEDHEIDDANSDGAMLPPPSSLPFQEEDEEEEHHEIDDTNSDGVILPPPSSLFHAAARKSDTRIFEYFLGVWDEQFSSTGGKNSDGDYPIHVICCDAYVSLQAIQVLVKRHAHAVAAVDGEQGLLPFHFAAMWDASLDVIYYLLQHCPDALRHVGKAAGVPARADESTVTVVETSNRQIDDSHHERQDHADCGPVKKKAKTTH